ncbi:succinate dehydrogenase assembly factor 3, mitochondrial-like [Strongylocentrotus purpuratus]|uniref:Succinate dehydrogenase assembly factor 3 n=1 Tax=Strongylocentrotus purpuratus TaxID=7668 RepID=A0A7M7NTW7_STRPU|nr:succinate dehydrogenase assembly factor 3, mitochondrial-like [Strongylocentrotus purpuratus]|eukprot:XP_793418.1 PREDICTED: succinate dehydrogenase assembly factor 3, mitochondrial [Strongylocentrotus purpuratus]
MAVSHVSAVRTLYRQILLLHRRLPLEMKALGDEYVKAEFRRHKNVKSEEVQNFMSEWQGYAAMLSAQTEGVKSEGEVKRVGLHLDGNQLEELNDIQVGQLYELYQETKKPSQFMQKEDS